MTYEKVTDTVLINRLYRPGKVQRVLMEFHAMDCQVIHVITTPG